MQEYSISFYMRQAWQDPRLAYDQNEAGFSEMECFQNNCKAIRTPDLFFRNEKDIKVIDIISPQRLMKINATGHVWYVVK